MSDQKTTAIDEALPISPDLRDLREAGVATGAPSREDSGSDEDDDEENDDEDDTVEDEPTAGDPRAMQLVLR